ncbi:MAG: NAD(P)/FAD-dependent oxidoreductase [Actinobacteria bacterium ATB1]|nr:NAD(P)/FAD-dependent oxidoreductase [Actinobacteria bacterium ATB1]
MGKPRVVIVGAGFAGLACARGLDGRPVDVLLVDRTNYHLFTPLLYQVATCLLNPSDIAMPLRKVFRGSPNVRFRQAVVTGIDLDARKVRTGEGDEIGYDRLVVAAGTEANYFSNQAIEAAALGLKTLPEALTLRNHTLRCLEEATSAGRDPAPWITFVVAGGGPTGVEYAGALAELGRLVLPLEYPEIPSNLFRVILVEGQDRLLPPFSEASGRHAAEALKRRGVEIRLSTLVSHADAETVTLSDGEVVRARTLVWSAGVRPAGLAEELAAPHARSRRVSVDERLGIAGRVDAFAVGDNAASTVEEGELPMLAPPAMQQGRYAAERILALEAGDYGYRRFLATNSVAGVTLGATANVRDVDPDFLPHQPAKAPASPEGAIFGHHRKCLDQVIMHNCSSDSCSSLPLDGQAGVGPRTSRTTTNCSAKY